MHQKDQELTHSGNRTKIRKPLILAAFRNSPWTGCRKPGCARAPGPKTGLICVTHIASQTRPKSAAARIDMACPEGGISGIPRGFLSLAPQNGED
jgi:hypothetical protein